MASFLMLATAMLLTLVGPGTAFIISPISSTRALQRRLSSPTGIRNLDASQRDSSNTNRATSRRGRTAMQAAARLVTGEELEVELTEWELPMILDVFATWCGPCIQLKPEIEKLSHALEGKCRVLKLDSDEEEDMAGALNIYGLPTVIYMKDGKIQHRTEGFLPAEEMLQLADIHLFGKPPPEVTDPADDLFIDADACKAPASAAGDAPSACTPPSPADTCPSPSADASSSASEP
ncbi:unnamed protein product [Ectocarpus sp. 12 AP-2014]